MRVLVADDDPSYRSLLEGLLTQWHFEVVLARDGAEAMDTLRRPDPPPLVILDWEMPGADGFEISRWIRGELGPDSAYVLMITGSRKRDEMEKVLVCGADDYLLKPFDPLDLKIHLRTATRVLHLLEELEDVRGTPRPKAIKVRESV